MARTKKADARLQEMGITMEDVENFRRHRAQLRRCNRSGRSKYKTQEGNLNDDYEAAAKWKHDNDAKEAKKRQREEKLQRKGKVRGQRKQQLEEEAEEDSSAESSDSDKRRKTEGTRQGKKVVVESGGSSSSEKEPSIYGSDEEASPAADTEDDDNVVLDVVRGKLMKKLRLKQRSNVAPEAKEDYNKSALEEYSKTCLHCCCCPNPSCQ